MGIRYLEAHLSFGWFPGCAFSCLCTFCQLGWYKIEWIPGLYNFREPRKTSGNFLSVWFLVDAYVDVFVSLTF